MSTQQEMMERRRKERGSAPAPVMGVPTPDGSIPTIDSWQPTQQELLDRRMGERENKMGVLDYLSPVAKGMSFGFNDEFAGLVGAGVNSLGNLVGMGNEKSLMDNYRMHRDAVRKQVNDFTEVNPKSSMALEGVGALGTGMYGGAKYLAGKAGGMLYGDAMRLGGMEGLTQSYGELTGDEPPFEAASKMGQGFSIGSIAGGSMPMIGAGMKTAAKYGYNKITGSDLMRNRPAQFMKDLIEGGGDSQQAILDRSARLDADSTFTEAAESGVTAGQAVLSRNPELIPVARRGIADRIKGSTARVMDVVHDLTGHRPPSIEETRRLAQKRIDDSAPEYAKFSNSIPEYRDDLGKLMERPSMVKAWKQAQQLAREKGDELPELFENIDGKMVSTGEYPDFRAWDYMKQTLWDVEQSLYRKGANKQASAIGDTRHQLTNILDDIEPNYKAAREAWGTPSQAMELIEQGQRFFKDESSVVIDDLHNMTQRDKTNYLTGMWDAAVEKMGKPQEGFKSSYSFWDTTNVKRKLRALFPDGEEGEAMLSRLQQRIDAENRLRDVNNKVLENSQTYPKKAALDKLNKTRAGVMDWMTSPINTLQTTARNALDPKMPDLGELGHVMFGRGGTRDTIDWINQVGMSPSEVSIGMGRVEGLSDIFSQYATGGAGAMSEQIRQRYME